MTEPRDLRQTDAWGIDRFYRDAFDTLHRTSDETRRAVMHAMGADAGTSGPAEKPPVMFLRAGSPACVLAPGELTLETGEMVRVKPAVPVDLPIGYHELRPDVDSGLVRVIVSPDRCYLPGDLKTWGWSVQLYALRSQRSWGIGDLADLRRFARCSSENQGARVLMINPLHAASPVIPQQASPYYPTSRRYRNPLYLAIEDIPGASEVCCDIERLAAAGGALNSLRLIDRDAVFRLKMQALECIWQHARHDAGFETYQQREGRDLECFATFCALAERHGGKWQEWPAEIRDPESAAVRAFVRDHIDRIRFHIWLQWLLDSQLAACSREIAVMQDLPVGADPGGADAWVWQHLIATGVSIGAPPDKFNTAGQDWGLPPFIPSKLRAAGYEPFIQTIRATLRHAGGLRIDHVLGFFRLFWVPEGLGPAKGAYVRYNSDELLAIVALESHRARAFIVGEDLGTVEPGVSEKLQRNNVLSYRVFWFEKGPPSTYPETALSAVSTHDLPTIAGMWSGSDLQAQKRLGLNPGDEQMKQSRNRIERFGGIDKNDSVRDVILKTHELLAAAPSRIITAQIDDALAVEERPNMPATTGEQWPNWSIALPKTLEQIEHDPLVQAVAAELGRER
jgi:4-alpha-glucanotransferase